jgi:hypothetical protein
MKNNQRRLKALLKMIPESNFKKTIVEKDCCILLGDYSRELCAKIMGCKFKASVDKSTGILLFSRGLIRIALS